MENYIIESETYQSHFPGDTSGYVCADNMEMGTIGEGSRIYQLTTRDQDGNLREGGSYFFDQATFDRFYDAQTESFDAAGLSQALQVAPYYDEQVGYTYKGEIVGYDVNRPVEAAMGTCEANIPYGGGGGAPGIHPFSEGNRASGRRDFDKKWRIQCKGCAPRGKCNLQ